ncbi:MAG: SH3 domain-containing protein [Mesorhizobium sp.]
MRMPCHRWNVAFRIAALACLTPMTAIAEENLGWHGQKGEHGASLFYGIPQTDRAPLSFSCARGSDELTFAFAFAPINAVDGVKVEVLLEAGDIAVPIATTGARIEMDDSFILEGRTVLDARLTDLITSRGTLSVFVEDGAEEYQLDGAREAAAALIETCTGKAASAPASETTKCDLAAWVMKGAPADLAVRSGPGPDYAAVATVPRPYTDGEEIYFPQVTITGSRDGWFRISEVITELHGGWPTDPIVTFSGEGWLPGTMLRLWVESGRLWSLPSEDAPIAATFASDDFRLDALHACTGVWVEVEGTYGDQRPRGWTTDVCASQVTTCP